MLTNFSTCFKDQMCLRKAFCAQSCYPVKTLITSPDVIDSKLITGKKQLINNLGEHKYHTHDISFQKLHFKVESAIRFFLITSDSGVYNTSSIGNLF